MNITNTMPQSLNEGGMPRQMQDLCLNRSSSWQVIYVVAIRPSANNVEQCGEKPDSSSSQRLSPNTATNTFGPHINGIERSVKRNDDEVKHDKDRKELTHEKGIVTHHTFLLGHDHDFLPRRSVQSDQCFVYCLPGGRAITPYRLGMGRNIWACWLGRSLSPCK